MMVQGIWPVVKLISTVLVFNLSEGHYSIEPFHGGDIGSLRPSDVAFAPFPATGSSQNDEPVPIISSHHHRHRRKSLYNMAPSSPHSDIRPISGLQPTRSYTPLHPPELAPTIKGRHIAPSPLSQGDCSFMECSEPLIVTPPDFPCLCVSPIKVAIRLGIPLYTFFPLVSELSKEVAAGTMLKQSQVRIVGANSGGPRPQKTVVLIHLIPFQTRFDAFTAFRTYYNFWHKRISINTSLFGNYDVLRVQYSGLPPAPPIGSSKSNGDELGEDDDGRVIKPVGINVGDGTQNRKKLSHSVVASIVVSASIAIGLCSFAACVLLKFCSHHPTLKLLPPPIPSGRSGGMVSTVESGLSIASVSLSSTISTMYTGSAKFFTSGDISRATYNFDPTKVLGEGGFGLVYGGILDDGTKVAIKILKRVDEKSEREFLSEVEMHTRLHHRNLVKLIGLCTEQEGRSLVYELISNGSLESHLHGVDKETSPLDWDARMKIAVGTARALAYLHEDSSPSVIHRDFKSSNILLEGDFSPRVSDFGLAKTTIDDQNKHGSSSHVMGTFGYVAPEYAMTGNFLVKSDVYSYGVVLLELLSGRRPVDMRRPPGQESLVTWARVLLSTPGGLQEILDPYLLTRPGFSIHSGSRVATIASVCIHPDPSCRPFMSEVLQALRLVCTEHGSTEPMSEAVAPTPGEGGPRERFSFLDFLTDGGRVGRLRSSRGLMHSMSADGRSEACGRMEGSPWRWVRRCSSYR